MKVRAVVLDRSRAVMRYRPNSLSFALAYRGSGLGGVLVQ